MLHPLVQSCLEITNAGYRKDDNWQPPWMNHHLRNLGNFLLNGSDTGRAEKYSLKAPGSPKKYDVALMYGGGIDSYCALKKAQHHGLNVVAMMVDYGQPYHDSERTALENVWSEEGGHHFASSFHDCLMIPRDMKLDLGWENYIIPARNLVLAAIGSTIADTVWINANKRSDETVGTPDKTARFYREASRIFSDFHNRTIKVTAPFLNSSKQEQVQWCFENIKGFSLSNMFAHTFSCYTPVNGRHCGVCYACSKRFTLAQKYDFVLHFNTHPINGPNWDAFRRKELAKGRS